MKLRIGLWILLLFVTSYPQQYVVTDSVKLALSLLPSINRTMYDVTEAAYVDTFKVFWPDDGIQIDSIKCISDDSVTVQVRIDGASTTNLFTDAVLINGTTTLSSFSDALLAAGDKAYLYFILIGDTLTILEIKFYWRYL